MGATVGYSVSNALSQSRVIVWRASIDDFYADIPLLTAILSADEKRRAERYYSQRRAHQFILGRALLRLLLSRYLDVDPWDISLSVDAYGKPSVSRLSGVDFNVSHSGDLVCLAFSRNRRLGIDVEQLDSLMGDDRVTRRVLAPRERSELASLPESDRLSVFYRRWVLKEAYLKARGTGFSTDPRSVELSMTCDDVAPHRIAGDESESLGWTLREVPVADGYAAAVAAEGDDWDVDLRRVTSLAEV